MSKTLTTPGGDLRRKLEDTRQELDALRQLRATKARAAEDARKRFIDAPGHLNPDSEEGREAQKARTAVGEVDDRIGELQKNHIDYLRQLSGEQAVRAKGGKPGAWLGAELRYKALSTVDAGLGAAMTPMHQPDIFWEKLSPASALLASGVQVLDTERDEVRIPRLQTDPTAAWVLEGAAIPESEGDGDTITARPKKVAVLSVISTEAWSDATDVALAAYERSLIRSVANKLDAGFFEGSGTDPQIRGLRNVAGIQTVSMGTNGAALTSLDPIIQAVGALAAANARASAIVMHPLLWSAVLQLKSTAGEYLISESSAPTGTPVSSILGLPVLTTSQLSRTETQGSNSDASSIYVVDGTEIVAVRRKDPTLQVSTDFGFQTDQIGVRVTARYDLVVPNPEAVVRIVGVRV